MGSTRQLLAAILSLLVILAYVVIFGSVSIFYPEAQSGSVIMLAGIELATDPLAYVWTGVSVLVGGVVAVAFGQPEPKRIFGITPEMITNIYTIAYFGVGAIAVIECFAHGAKTNLLIINAATTCLGLALPIVSAFLRPGPSQQGLKH
jgi:hypothetical protein